MLTVHVVRHMHAEINTYAHTCFRTCATWSRFRRRDANLCRTKSDSISVRPGVERGWERAGARKGNGEQEKWATVTLELSSVWQCSTTTTLVGLSAHYVDQRSHSRTAVYSIPPVLSLIRDQELLSLLPEASRRYQCRME